MSFGGRMRMYARFGLGLPAFFRRRMGPGEATHIIRRRLKERDTAFLRLLQRAVFANDGNPYLTLFRLAGYDAGDVRAMVARRGLEDALRALCESGVYVTFEEFKGRRPLVRKGQKVPVEPEDFDNPHLRHYYGSRTSGSTGRPTRVSMDLDHLAYQLPVRLLTFHAHGFLGVPTILWRATLPVSSGVSNALRFPLMGNRVLRWFTPISPAGLGQKPIHRMATEYIVLASRLCGVAIPRPEPLPLTDPMPLLRAALKARRRAGKCLISCPVSLAVRACLAAADAGITLDEMAFTGAGEPPTRAKVAAIRQAGASYIPNYASSETGTIAAACARPADGSDVHLASDLAVLTEAPRQVPGWQTTVNAFHVTTLSPAAPKLMINVSLDDYGVLEKRKCGCPLGALGYDTHVRCVRSYGKLTGQGMTLINSDLERVLEERLPEQFGGGPQDYQLAEEEGEDGLTRLVLRISPTVRLEDEREVARALLRNVNAMGHAGRYAALVWGKDHSVEVRRVAPVWTHSGKLLPLAPPGGRGAAGSFTRDRQEERV